MKVLLVDDEIKFVTMLAKRLKIRGVNAAVAVNGKEALKLAAETRFNVAVLDIKMPGISGIDLRNELSGLNKDLKFIFVTGHGAIDRNEKKFEPDDIFLSKPLNISVLIETIETLVSNGEEPYKNR